VKALGKVPDDYDDWDAERRFAEDPAKDQKRNSFEIDKGRIIHSAAFRRLQGKTQVLGAGERDFYRTRLTHSLEVAQIGRGICNESENKTGFKPDSDLVETICLAHDIGHPAFGHAGEEELHKQMLEHGGFGANPQNLRLVTFLEQKHKGGESEGGTYDGGGLNLSRAALDGLIKYSDLFKRPEFDGSSNFTYFEDETLLKWIKGGRKGKSLECQIADWADAVAYSVDDTEDAFRAGILDFEQMKQRAGQISNIAKKKLEKARIADDPSITAPTAIQDEAKKLEDISKILSLRQRKRALKAWTSGTIGRLLRPCEIVLRDENETCCRYKFELVVQPSAHCLAQVLKTTAKLLVFDDPRVKTLEAKGVRILKELFVTFVDDQTLLPLDFQEYINDELGTKERLVADFVAGMTDRYAYAYYRRLFEPGAGSFYEDV
jgi:dGTPase